MDLHSTENQHLALPEGRTTGQLVQDVLRDVQGIFRSEVKLAKMEAKEEATKAFRGIALLAGGALIGLLAMGFFLWALIYLLTTWLSPAASTLIVALMLGITAGLLVAAGRKQMEKVHAVPEKTAESVKENVEWLKQQNKYSTR